MAKTKRQNHGRNLGADHDSLPIEPVRHDAAQRRYQEHGNLAGESDCAQQQRRAGLAINQPRLCNILHPGADQGDELSAEEKLEVTVA